MTRGISGDKGRGGHGKGGGGGDGKERGEVRDGKDRRKWGGGGDSTQLLYSLSH